MEDLRDRLLKTSRTSLIDLCVSDASAVKICGTESFVEEYNAIHPPKSMVKGRNQDIIYPMHDIEYYGKMVEPPLGSGTFGIVYKLEGKNGKFFAMKVFTQRIHEEGVRDDAITEIAILRRLNHPNITKLIDIIGGKNFADTSTEQRIVLELAMFDLDMFIRGKHRSAVDTELIKSYMYQLSRGLLYLHDNDIIHRDLKPPNILVFDEGTRVAISDFGTSQAGFIPGKKLSLDVQTAWWRAPEIFLGTKMTYGKEIDIFSLGVIFADLFLGNNIFAYNDEHDMLLKQISLLGHMTEDEWPGISDMNKYTAKIKAFAASRKKDKWDKEVEGVRYPVGKIYMSDQALDIIKRMTYPIPSKRANIREILASSYFNEIGKIVRREFPFKDNGPYVCGSNMDSSRLNITQIHTQEDITVKILRAEMDWLLSNKTKFDVSSITISHTRLLSDYYMVLRPKLSDPTLFPLDLSNLRCTIVACLLISTKMFEIKSPSVKKFVKIGEGVYDTDQLLDAELAVLKVVNFDLYFPTPFEYMYHALGGLEWDSTEDNLSDLHCLLIEPINTRLDGYALAYIISRYFYNESLSECFYDEFYSIKKIATRAGHILTQVFNFDDGVALKIKSDKNIGKIFEKWMSP